MESSTTNSVTSSSDIRANPMSTVTSNSIQARPATLKLKKPQQAPKRFKSSFIFFSMYKHKEVKAELQAGGETVKTIHVAKIVSQAWKSLSAEEREKWELLAKDDKTRFEAEKSRYNGPWKVAVGKRKRKDPKSPKRPMSSFLAFSNKRRGMVKRQNPQMGNGELSKALSVMWKEAPEELRQKYIQDEATKREAYKVAMAAWKKENRGERHNEYLWEQDDASSLLTGVAEQTAPVSKSHGVDDHHRALQEGSTALKPSSRSNNSLHSALSNSLVSNLSVFPSGDHSQGLSSDMSLKATKMNPFGLAARMDEGPFSLLYPNSAQESVARLFGPSPRLLRHCAAPGAGPFTQTGSAILNSMMRQRLQANDSFMLHQHQQFLLAQLRGMESAAGGGNASTAFDFRRGNPTRDDDSRYQPASFSYPGF